MKEVTVISRNNAKEEGYTQVEKQSEIRRRAFSYTSSAGEWMDTR